MKTDLGGAPTDLDTRRAYARALLDHHYRRQAEMSEEAENQKRGDHDPAFLEARSIAGGREPPRLLRDCLPKRPAYMGDSKGSHCSSRYCWGLHRNVRSSRQRGRRPSGRHVNEMRRRPAEPPRATIYLQGYCPGSWHRCCRPDRGNRSLQPWPSLRGHYRRRGLNCACRYRPWI